MNGRDTWSVTLREIYRLREFKKRVLRRLFGGGMEEMAGGWRRVHNESSITRTLHSLFKD
jgi:hypothetical protein